MLFNNVYICNRAVAFVVNVPDAHGYMNVTVGYFALY